MKQIPALLQTDLDQDATTFCLILRVRTKAGDVYGFTNLDADVTYDPATYDPEGTGDDWGSVLHKADQGFTPERLQASADLNVDNTDLQGWVSDTGVTEEQIRAGLFDYAEVRCYRVNYMDLSHGHEVVFVGTCGETKFSAHGWKTEFRSLTQQLKQPISKLYSLKCRAKFGDAQCTKAFTWVAGSVTSVGAETDRIFTDTSIAEADGHFDLGVVEWLTGNNAGAQMEIDTHASDVLTLSLPLAYAIQVGDTYQRRQDCDKTAAMCKDTHNNLVNMRAELFIPIADAGASMVPGAQL